jgi:cell division protein FtsL
MTNRTVVIRKKSCGWRPKTKRKIQPIITAQAVKNRTAGFISPVFIVLACMAFSGLFYMYSVNQTAIKGIEASRVQRQIDDEKKRNESLKIKEAELESLYRIEDASKQLDMVAATNVNYIEESPAVAYAGHR